MVPREFSYFQCSKTESIFISRKTSPPQHPPIIFQGFVLDTVPKHKHLGITLRSDLRWNDHISEVIMKSSKLINIMKSLKYILDWRTLETVYTSFIRPILEYASPVWSGCTEADAKRLEDIQLQAARIVTGAMYGTSIDKLYEEVGWQSLVQHRESAKLTLCPWLFMLYYYYPSRTIIQYSTTFLISVISKLEQTYSIILSILQL